MRGLRSRRSGEVLFGSAGWLFADLMLALVMMLVLTAAVATPDEPEDEPPPPSPTTTTTTTPPPTTTTTAPPPRLLPNPYEFNVRVDTDALLRNDRGTITALRNKVRSIVERRTGGRRAGIVLTFGSASSANIQRGVDIASRFNDKVLRSLGGQFAGTAFRSYFQGGDDPDKITYEIFVFDR